MIYIVRLTVAEAATALVTFVQYTLGLALAAILVYTIPDVNPANSWSVVARMLQSSLWAVLLRTDSTATNSAGFRISLFSALFLLTGVLTMITSVITPLGLKDGPPLQVSPTPLPASYVRDTSPFGLATSSRTSYQYSRICGDPSPIICPGNDDANTSIISPSILETLGSTFHGPFNMQFRQYYLGRGGYNYSMYKSHLTTLEHCSSRRHLCNRWPNCGYDRAIATYSILSKVPIGLWNHTFPSVAQGGTWSEEVLWLEPVSFCVNTNLTFDYTLVDRAVIFPFNLTDRGGLFNLTTVYQSLSRDGQHIDLYQHAYKGAVLSNFMAMTVLTI